MRRVLAIRLSCFVIVTFFFGSTLNSGPCARTKHFTQAGVFVHFFLLVFSFFIFCANLPFTTERDTVVCHGVASFKLLMKKSDFPTAMCFRGRHSIRLANACSCSKWANPRTESYTSGSRTPSVDLRFRSFSIKRVESTRSSSIGFSFSAFLASPFKQK